MRNIFSVTRGIDMLSGLDTGIQLCHVGLATRGCGHVQNHLKQCPMLVGANPPYHESRWQAPMTVEQVLDTHCMIERPPMNGLGQFNKPAISTNHSLVWLASRAVAV